MPNQELKISPETQYKEVYENRRQHDRFIWQTPSIIVALDAAAVVASWAVEGIPWWAREFIIAFALILTAVLTFALIKHRYFIDLEQKTLLALEKEHAQKCIQRMTKPKSGLDYWAKSDKPHWLQNISAHWVFVWAMCLICVLLLILLFVNPLCYVRPLSPQFWSILGLAVIVVSLAIFWLVRTMRNMYYHRPSSRKPQSKSSHKSP
jgi:hypothetical protein